MFAAVTKWIIPFVAVSFSVRAQNLSGDLDKIVSSIDSASTMAIEASVKVYGRKGGDVVYSTTASVYRSGSTSMTLLGDQEYYVGSQYDVTVDHEEKSVLILKKEAAKKKPKKKSVELDASALKKFLETDEKQPRPKIVLISNNGGKKTYGITNVTGFKEIRIVLDMNALSISSVTYEYSEQSESKGQYVTVVYNRFQKDADVGSKLQTSNYFTGSDDAYKLVSRLKNYKLYTEL